MSLLWLEGFESFGTTLGGAPSPSGIMATKYTMSFESLWDIEASDLTGNCIECNLGFLNTPLINVDDADDTLIVGFRVKFAKIYNASSKLMTFISDSTDGASLYMESGALMFKDATGAYSVFSEVGLQSGTWYYIEVKAKNHDTTGTLEAKINGTSVLSLTSLDTKGTALTYYNHVKLYGVSTVLPRYDDLYICNGAGSVNNDFLGPIVVKELRPNADDTNNFVTASPSATHYENVDEAVSDENTSYNQGNAAGAQELYGYDTLSGLATVTGVALDSNLRNNTDTDEDFQHYVDSNGTTANSANVTIGVSSFNTFAYIVELDPDTSSAWTTSGVNAAKFGIELQ